MIVVPQPHVGVDRFSDGAKNAQRAAARAPNPLLAFSHQRADCSRRGIEDPDVVLVDDLPKPRRVRVIGHPLEHQGRSAIGERPVDDVAVPGHPTDIGGAPVDFAVTVVEDVFMGHRRVDEVASGGV